MPVATVIRDSVIVVRSGGVVTLVRRRSTTSLHLVLLHFKDHLKKVAKSCNNKLGNNKISS